MDINTLYQEYLLSSGVSIDSRSIKPNQIFFALPGTKVKGSQYASDALNKGARLALVEDEGLAQNESKFFFTPDALLALQNLAIHHRNHLQIPIIGITGSAGKTTTKELISKVLSKKYVVSSTQGNLNNHIGVPLTLLGITPQTQIGIVEMGANHINEIEALCEIARPTHGLITSIGKAHLEGFGSLEG
ncbi:MAG: UDP-N-acetylmuramoylalanyl-D-glutamyl-2, 6-diaminopimelate--D-alanyl-D-alanine ligase, partial [Saprospiraceae bacterium]|nr:UDP-N-acetylmuramoylalanyl-D-glutamyl-2, 6-diaminopimelate--D-alanyl-D-alanine ligase [Saprospiraceae bacterium]